MSSKPVANARSRSRPRSSRSSIALGRKPAPRPAPRGSWPPHPEVLAGGGRPSALAALQAPFGPLEVGQPGAKPRLPNRVLGRTLLWTRALPAGGGPPGTADRYSMPRSASSLSAEPARHLNSSGAATTGMGPPGMVSAGTGNRRCPWALGRSTQEAQTRTAVSSQPSGTLPLGQGGLHVVPVLPDGVEGLPGREAQHLEAGDGPLGRARNTRAVSVPWKHTTQGPAWERARASVDLDTVVIGLFAFLCSGVSRSNGWPYFLLSGKGVGWPGEGWAGTARGMARPEGPG